jgi:thiol-disulfide isomerase/thioredoxin
MKVKRFILTFFLFCAAAGAAFPSGYNIRIRISGLQDTTVIMGHYLSKSMYPDDTIRLNSKGVGQFMHNKALPQGIYIIYLPNTKYFEFIVGEDQDFSIEADTADFIKSLVFKGSAENDLFIGFQRYMVTLRKQADSVSTLLRAAKDPAQKEALTAKMKQINETRVNRIESIGKENPNLFVPVFLKATLDEPVPDPPRDAKGKIMDSTWQYRYYRKHYFDNFNVSDPRLLRTPIYEDRVMTYITRVVPQIPDTLYPEIDMLLQKAHADSAIYRYMLITLFNHYGKSNIMGLDAVQVYLAEKYYLHDAWWSDAKFLADLKDRVEKTKPLLIGQKAPDVELMLVPSDHFMRAAQDTALRRYPHVGTKVMLDQLKGGYMVVVFWEADCGHCKKAIPELYDIYEKSLKGMGVKVLAISTLFGEDGKIKWVNFVNEHKLYDWMNAWNPYSYDFKLKYDILSTPQIYILDENEKIVAKKIGPEQVTDILNELMKNKQPKKQ